VQALVGLPIMHSVHDSSRTAEYRLLQSLMAFAARRFRPRVVEGEEAPKASSIEFIRASTRTFGATMVWGSQQTNLFPGAKVDGVFSMWYGKGPGVDRCGTSSSTAMRRALEVRRRARGSRPTTTPPLRRRWPHGSELEFVSAIDARPQSGRRAGHPRHGLMGWRMSRFTGRWVGFKTIAKPVESSGLGAGRSPPARTSSSRPISNCRRAGSTSAWPDPR